MISTKGRSVKGVEGYIDSLIALGAKGDAEGVKHYIKENEHVLTIGRTLGYVGVIRGRVQIGLDMKAFDHSWELRNATDLMLHFNGDQEYVDYISECMIRLELIEEELENLWY